MVLVVVTGMSFGRPSFFFRECEHRPTLIYITIIVVLNREKFPRVRLVLIDAVFLQLFYYPRVRKPFTGAVYLVFHDSSIIIRVCVSL